MTTRSNWAKAHQIYADLFKQRFRDLWCRDLTAEETLVFENAPFCFSGMMLEMIELETGRMTSAHTANQLYGRLDSAVSEHGPEVLKDLIKLAEANDLLIAVGSSLLIIEQKLMEKIG